MKKVFWGLGVVGVLGVTSFAILSSRYEPLFAQGTKIGVLDIGGLSSEDASRKLLKWWDSEKINPVALQLAQQEESFVDSCAGFGIDLDVPRTLEQAAPDGYVQHLKRMVSGERSEARHELMFKQSEADLSRLDKFVSARVPARQPARVTYTGGSFHRVPEVSGFTLDKGKVFDAALEAMKSSSIGRIPVITAQKKIDDAQLGDINEIVSEFTTRFSEGKASRSHNIRMAARFIDGVVLAPGEQFSFNKTVGRRTPQRGFREAGVYKDGKHDVDIGGGICQVSTTLYNASLFANLKIIRRSNHSMPVPYVPLGRDATVDYGSADLVIQNSSDKPVALSATVGRGAITFRVLGKKDSATTVRLESGPASSWDVGETQEPDPTLPAGKTKIIEKGSRGHRITTYRVVFQDGKAVKKESLGSSVYRGGKRIIAVGTAAAPDPVDTVPAPEPPDEHDGI